MKMKRHAASLALSVFLALSCTAAYAETEDAAPAAEEQAFDPSDQISAAREMDTSRTADASDMTTVEEVGDPSAAPVTADLLKDGVYEVSVECSSSMFKIRKAFLTVADNKMWIDLEMEGEGYLFLYPGTAEEAAAADAGSFLYYDTNPEGYRVFQDYPLEALNQKVPCAAFSKKKEQWYDRTLFFGASSLDASAYNEAPGNTVSETGLADGTYQIDCILGNTGGNTALQSSIVTVKDGNASVRIEFNTGKFDYVKVDGVQYDAVEGEENAVFEFPVTVFDREIPMIADSTAIQGMQVEKEFTITLVSESAVLK